MRSEPGRGDCSIRDGDLVPVHRLVPALPPKTAAVCSRCPRFRHRTASIPPIAGRAERLHSMVVQTEGVKLR